MAKFDVHDRGDLERSRSKWRKLELELKKRYQEARAARMRRDKQLAALAKKNTGAAKAVKWALAQVGTLEKPPGSNDGPKIREWTRATGYGFPVAWCQVFANAAAVAAGCPQLRTGYTPSVLRGISAGDKVFVPVREPRAGDFVFFKWPGVSRDPCDHVGVVVKVTATTVTAVEGNTSPGNAGSQNNGGGVFLRTRPRSLVAGWVRPPYKEA